MTIKMLKEKLSKFDENKTVVMESEGILVGILSVYEYEGNVLVSEEVDPADKERCYKMTPEEIEAYLKSLK